VWALRQGINNLIGQHHNNFEEQNRLGFLLTINAPMYDTPQDEFAVYMACEAIKSER